VKGCLAQFHTYMALKGFPGNEAKWRTGAVYKAFERFKDPTEAELDYIYLEGPKPDEKRPASISGLIETKNNLVMAVGTGQCDVQSAYASLIEAIEALEG